MAINGFRFMPTPLTTDTCGHVCSLARSLLLPWFGLAWSPSSNFRLTISHHGAGQRSHRTHSLQLPIQPTAILILSRLSKTLGHTRALALLLPLHEHTTCPQSPTDPSDRTEFGIIALHRNRSSNDHESCQVCHWKSSMIEA